MTIFIETMDVHYLKPNLTIEMVLVYPAQAMRPQYRCIRNDGGVYFKVFECFDDALSEEHEQAQFQCEQDLDKYLRNLINIS
jgi:hypothetical protein